MIKHRRLACSLFLSLLMHALLLSLTFGDEEFGLPGLGFPWEDRRGEAPRLHIVLAPPVQPVRPEPTATDQTDLLQPSKLSQAAPRQAAPQGLTIVSPPAKPLTDTDQRQNLHGKVDTASAPARGQERGASTLPQIAEPRNTEIGATDRIELEASAPPPSPTSDTAAAQNTASAEPVAASPPDPSRAVLEQIVNKAPDPMVEQAAWEEAERHDAARLAEAERQETSRLAVAKLEAQQQELARQEAARAETARQEAEQREAASLAAAEQAAQQQEAARQEAARQEAARAEAARQGLERREAARLAAAELEAKQQAAARQEVARAEAAQLEAERKEAARLAAAELEAQQQAAARQEAARQEAARAEAVRQETERREAARLAAAEQETQRQAAASQNAARAEATRQEAERREAARLAAAAVEAKREERLRAIGRQLDAEAAQRAASGDDQARQLPFSLSTARRIRLFGRAHANAELVQYAEAWARRIQSNTRVETVREIATLPHRNALVTVAMRSDGSVESVTFDISSGTAAVDVAIRRIVNTQKPYVSFPPALAREYDVIEIRRSWVFSTSLRLQ